MRLCVQTLILLQQRYRQRLGLGLVLGLEFLRGRQTERYRNIPNDYLKQKDQTEAIRQFFKDAYVQRSSGYAVIMTSRLINPFPPTFC